MKSRNRIETSGLSALYPFSSHFLERNGLKYHFIDEGTGDPIVMLHGNPTWSFYFRTLVKELSSEYRTIVPDHIGCGLSDKPDSNIYDYRLKSRVDDIEALLAFLDIRKKITLILHDWGGMIGMSYAIRHPESIERLVVMNTAAFLPPLGKRIPIRLLTIRNFKLLANIAVLGLNLFALSALFMASHKGLSREVKSGLIAPYNCWKNRVAILKFVQDIPMSEKDPSYDLVKETDENLNQFSKIPMLICWGKRDFVFDTEYLDEWKRRFPKAEVYCYPEAGHYVLEDVPDKIVLHLHDFLKRHSL
jgi:pimeloyl-ACP methyl ester carboxylesterase